MIFFSFFVFVCFTVRDSKREGTLRKEKLKKIYHLCHHFKAVSDKAVHLLLFLFLFFFKWRDMCVPYAPTPFSNLNLSQRKRYHFSLDSP